MTATSVVPLRLHFLLAEVPKVFSLFNLYDGLIDSLIRLELALGEPST